METERQLTDEQRAIVDAPPDARILVTAGAGTGKTHVLAARIGRLISNWDVAPGSELLILTFSRSAVAEVRRRLASTDTDAVYARAMTFDSFATALLAKVRQDTDWLTKGYDGRIAEAVATLKLLPEARAALATYKHVLVDELQDLVAERAELVRTILTYCEGGFTLLGDPAQAIYDFMLEGASVPFGSAELYAWIRTWFGSELREHSLSANLRAQTADAKRALWAGPLLGAPQPDYPAILEGLDRDALSLPSLGPVKTAASSLRVPGRRTAILCRTNGQALLLSRALHELGLPHRLQRSATDRILPAWLALVARHLPRVRVSRSAFRRAFVATGIESPDDATAWATFKTIEAGSGNDLDLRRTAERIRLGQVPDQFSHVDDADLVVSTIHRAKGLEFDRVLLALPERRDDADPETFGAEARALYVALTRARSSVYHMEPPDARGLRQCEADKRWARWGPQPWRLTDFEVRGGDTHSLEPAGAVPYTLADPAAIQQYIRDQVRPGDSATLDICQVSDNGTPREVYTLRHEGTIVGTTGDDFGKAFYSVLRARHGQHVRWPTRIDNLRVEAVDTVAGVEGTAPAYGLGAADLWLRVRVVGLGGLRFG